MTRHDEKCFDDLIYVMQIPICYVFFLFFTFFLEVWCIALLVYLNWDSMAWTVMYYCMCECACACVRVLIELDWIRHGGNGMYCYDGYGYGLEVFVFTYRGCTNLMLTFNTHHSG